jgi:putative transposase
MNAICERLVDTLCREVLDRMLISWARRICAPSWPNIRPHYNTARPHQGIAQHVPDDDRDAPRVTVIDLDTGRLDRRSVLNGLIK